MRTVDRSAAVLVLIDMQDRLADVMPRRDAVVGAAAFLARSAVVLDVPVLVTRQYPAGLGDTVAELREVDGAPPSIDKTAFSCMAEPAFAGALAATGRRQVVLTGMETHICVTQTALDLLMHGFEVFIVADATCSRSDADHAVALDRLRAAGAVVLPGESVVYEMLGEAGTPAFKAVLPLVKARDAAGSGPRG